MRELRDQVSKASYFRGRIPSGLCRPIQPERAASLGREMPLDDLPHVGVERVVCSPRKGFGFGLSRHVSGDYYTCRGMESAGSAAKYLSIVFRLGGLVRREPATIQRAEPNTIGTTVMKPFQKLTSPRGFRNSTLIASLPWPSCQMMSPALW